MNRWVRNDFLMHYGTKGMKWGVRNFIDENGHLTEAGKERYYSGNGGSFTPSARLNKRKQSIEGLKNRIKTMNGVKKGSEDYNRREQLKTVLGGLRSEYNRWNKEEREAYASNKAKERTQKQQEKLGLNTIHNYITGNKRLMKSLEKNQNMRYKGGQNKKIDFEQVIGQYNKRNQADIDARKVRNAANMQNLKNENERWRNMDIREATKEENVSKIRNKYTKPAKKKR